MSIKFARGFYIRRDSVGRVIRVPETRYGCEEKKRNEILGIAFKMEKCLFDLSFSKAKFLKINIPDI